MLISICGKSCSGKSFLAKKIVDYFNGIHIDVDKIAHEVLKNDLIKQKLYQNFGNVFFENGEVDRKKLGKIVFNNKKDMEILEDITWNSMEIEIDKIIQKNTNRVIVLDYLLLPKTKYFKKSKYRILLDIPYEIRKERALIRDYITRDEFDLREKASYDYRKSDFDFVLDNNDDIAINSLLNRLL